ncbi:MAG TPA: hypothetical protein VEH77_14255 [Roseiarcus sp.]|nr:hypothetical protein [Roseiarcus sp.]
MNEIPDTMDIAANLPWQWSVGAVICWAIVICLCLIFFHPEQRAPRAIDNSTAAPRRR